MKDASWTDDAFKPVSSGIALDIARVNPFLNWARKTCIVESLKKKVDMYIVRVGPKGALMKRCSGSA